MISNDISINKKIVELRKNKFGFFRIQKWLIQWDNFSKLDEQIVLAHILNVLKDNNLSVKKSEILYCFNKNYSRNFHGDKRSYLNWIYGRMKQ